MGFLFVNVFNDLIMQVVQAVLAETGIGESALFYHNSQFDAKQK